VRNVNAIKFITNGYKYIGAQTSVIGQMVAAVSLVYPKENFFRLKTDKYIGPVREKNFSGPPRDTFDKFFDELEPLFLDEHPFLEFLSESGEVTRSIEISLTLVTDEPYYTLGVPFNDKNPFVDAERVNAAERNSFGRNKFYKGIDKSNYRAHDLWKAGWDTLIKREVPNHSTQEGLLRPFMNFVLDKDNDKEVLFGPGICTSDAQLLGIFGWNVQASGFGHWPVEAFNIPLNFRLYKLIDGELPREITLSFYNQYVFDDNKILKNITLTKNIKMSDDYPIAAKTFSGSVKLCAMKDALEFQDPKRFKTTTADFSEPHLLHELLTLIEDIPLTEVENTNEKSRIFRIDQEGRHHILVDLEADGKYHNLAVERFDDFIQECSNLGPKLTLLRYLFVSPGETKAFMSTSRNSKHAVYSETYEELDIDDEIAFAYGLALAECKPYLPSMYGSFLSLLHTLFNDSCTTTTTNDMAVNSILTKGIMNEQKPILTPFSFTLNDRKFIGLTVIPKIKVKDIQGEGVFVIVSTNKTTKFLDYIVILIAKNRSGDNDLVVQMVHAKDLGSGRGEIMKLEDFKEFFKDSDACQVFADSAYFLEGTMQYIKGYDLTVIAKQQFSAPIGVIV